MDNVANKSNDYGAEYLGLPSTGAEGGACAGPPPASSSDVCAAQEVVHRAPVPVYATGDDAAEKWVRPARRDEVFANRPKIRRTPPGMSKALEMENLFGRVDSVDLPGDEEEEEVFTRAPTRYKEEGHIKELLPDSRMELGLRSIAKVLQVIMDQNKKIRRYILRSKSVDPGIKEIYTSMCCCLEEVSAAFSGARDTHEENKGSNTGGINKARRRPRWLMLMLTRILEPLR